jgi:hypothetical protein
MNVEPSKTGLKVARFSLWSKCYPFVVNWGTAVTGACFLTRLTQLQHTQIVTYHFYALFYEIPLPSPTPARVETSPINISSTPQTAYRTVNFISVSLFACLKQRIYFCARIKTKGEREREREPCHRACDVSNVQRRVCRNAMF